MSLFLERIPPSMEAGQLRFLLEFSLLAPPSVSLPAEHAFAGKAAKVSTHFTPVRPFSWGREHWCIITKKPVALAAHRCHPETRVAPSSGIRSMSPHGGQFRLTFKSGVSHVAGNTPQPHPR